MPESPFVLLTVGCPASGKSTWCARHFITDRNRPDRNVFGLDEMRGWVADDPTDQYASDDALRVMDPIIMGRLGNRRGTVVDNTSTYASHRARITQYARLHGTPTAAVVFRTPLDQCLRWNSGRDNPVPTRVIERKWQQVIDELPLGTPAAETNWTCWIDPDGTVRYVTEPPEPFASQSWFAQARKKVVR